MLREIEVERTGYFGQFGGAFVPEMLRPNLEELADAFIQLTTSERFVRQLDYLLKTFVGRPTPLYRAERLAVAYGLEGVKLFLKREDLAHTGAHKINNALAQALLAKEMGKSRIIAETGAGQHGVATAAACALLDLPAVIYMGVRDMERQALNVARMRMYGAEVRPVSVGSCTLKDATNEALRDWIANPHDTYYLIGSVVGPHPFPTMVESFQAVIGDEIYEQLGANSSVAVPKVIIACVGGGSNAAGAFRRFLPLEGVKLVGVEGAGEGIASGRSAATTALGRPGVMHGSYTLLMQDGDGQVSEAHSISAGLDYPGIGPRHAQLFTSGRAQYLSATDTEALQAASLLARTEGIIPALESAHAVSILPKLAPAAGSVVVVVLSGRGDKDMGVYLDQFEGRQDVKY